MKQTVFTLLAMISYGLTIAQDTATLTAKKISRSETPAAVVTAVEEDFEDYTVTDFYTIPVVMVNTEWMVTVEDHLQPDEQLDHYTVQLKGDKGGTYHSLYDKDGNQIMSKLKDVNQPLPAAVSKAIVSNPKYKGYAPQSDMHYKLVNHKMNKEYWEVTVKRGSKTKKLYYAPDGRFLKEK